MQIFAKWKKNDQDDLQLVYVDASAAAMKQTPLGVLVGMGWEPASLNLKFSSSLSPHRIHTSITGVFICPQLVIP